MREIDFDIERFLHQILPSSLRTERQILWINALLNPLKTIWKDFLDFRKKAYLEATTTPQTLSLQNYMNQILAGGELKIEIVHSIRLDMGLSLECENLGSKGLPLENENLEPIELGLQNDTDLPDGADFVIYVYDSNIEQSKIEKILVDFNIVNKNYKII